jgi:hypothetical protein
MNGRERERGEEPILKWYKPMKPAASLPGDADHNLI